MLRRLRAPVTTAALSLGAARESRAEPKKAATPAPPRSQADLIYSHVAQRRCFLVGPINDDTAHTITLQLLHLDAISPGTPITLFINSGGGKVSAGLAIHDVMEGIVSPVRTVCLGRAQSMAAVLLAAGAKGSRCLAPSATAMVHQPTWDLAGARPALAIALEAAEVEGGKARFVALLARHTGRTDAECAAAIEHNRYMQPSEAVAWGLADAICTSLPPPPPSPPAAPESPSQPPAAPPPPTAA